VLTVTDHNCKNSKKGDITHHHIDI